MKKILAVLMSIIAVLVLASPAQADTDTWRWKRHHRVAAVIRTVISEESVYDLGICEDVNGPPTDPEVYLHGTQCSESPRFWSFKGRWVIRVQVGTFGVGGNPDQTVTDTAYPISLDLEPQGEILPNGSGLMTATRPSQRAQSTRSDEVEMPDWERARSRRLWNTRYKGVTLP